MDLSNKLQELEASNHGDYWIVRCPKCGKKEAYVYLDDVEKHQKNPSFKIPIRCNRLNKCGEVSYIEEIKVQEIPKVNDDDIIGISQKAIDKINNIAYFSAYLTGFDFDWRGISNTTLKNNGVIYLKDDLIPFMKGCGENAFADKFFKKKCYENRNLIFPIKDYDGNCERLLLRSTKKLNKNAQKEISMRLIKKSSEVWNKSDLINENIKYVFVTEGVPDALSVKEVSQEIGVVALPGVRKYKQLLKEIVKSEIAKSKTYILCFDNDEAGQECILKLGKELDDLDVKYDYFNLHSFKDMNDFLVGDRNLFFNTVKLYSGISTSFKFKRSNIKKEKLEEIVERKDENYEFIEASTRKFRFIRNKNKRNV